MSAAGACLGCASRGLLLGALAGHIDRAVDHRVGERARDLLALDDRELAHAVCPAGGAAALSGARAPERHEGLRRDLQAAGCWSTCRHRPGFPPALLAPGIGTPGALFGAGDPAVLADLAVERAATVVGSRRAGAYGREVAHELGRMLAASGIAVISGLALGVDSAAHEGALAAGGTTLAVLGTGADRPYPRSNRRLFGRIATEGAIISELPPRSPTFRWMFPARNRLMAALAEITVVVEAAERSGSLITAEMALEGGRLVGAVPGPVTSWRSSGTNKLLADGAAVIRDAQDVLDLLLGPGVAAVERTGPQLAPRERSVLGVAEQGAATAEAVCAELGVSSSGALAALGRLERDGYLRTDATGSLSRTTLKVPRPARGGHQRTALRSSRGGAAGDEGADDRRI